MTPGYKRPQGCLAQGFTLVEMLAALVVLGLIAGLLLPNFQRWHDRTQQRVNTGAIWMQLQKLYARAALLGSDFELTNQSAGSQLADGQPALQLPPGWQVVAQQRLLIHASGYCEKARLEFKGPDSRLRFDILSADCEMTSEVIATDKP